MATDISIGGLSGGIKFQLGEGKKGKYNTNNFLDEIQSNPY